MAVLKWSQPSQGSHPRLAGSRHWCILTTESRTRRLDGRCSLSSSPLPDHQVACSSRAYALNSSVGGLDGMRRDQVALAVAPLSVAAGSKGSAPTPRTRVQPEHASSAPRRLLPQPRPGARLRGFGFAGVSINVRSVFTSRQTLPPTSPTSEVPRRGREPALSCRSYAAEARPALRGQSRMFAQLPQLCPQSKQTVAGQWERYV
jgi:hypothetical protein